MFEKTGVRKSNFHILPIYKEGKIEPNCKPNEFLESSFFKEDYPHSNIPSNDLLDKYKKTQHNQ